MTEVDKRLRNPYKVIINKPSVLTQLKSNNEALEKIQKRLDDYLEMKRSQFPRFYFLSSDELIDILANAQNYEIIQGHLKTMFDNIVRIEISDGDITGMISNEKELVKFSKPRQTH